MRKIKILILAAVFAGLAACGPAVPYAGILTDVTFPRQITDNTVMDKTGEACTVNIFGFIQMGDSSIHQAAQNGGINKIGAVNLRINSILNIYTRQCTVVDGS